MPGKVACSVKYIIHHINLLYISVCLDTICIQFKYVDLSRSIHSTHYMHKQLQGRTKAQSIQSRTSISSKALATAPSSFQPAVTAQNMFGWLSLLACSIFLLFVAYSSHHLKILFMGIFTISLYNETFGQHIFFT